MKRVLTRLHAVEGWPGKKAVENQLWELAEQLTPDERLCDYTQAIMDFGATLCGRRPNCSKCPLTSHCQAYQAGNPSDYPTSKGRKTLPTRTTRMLILKDTHNQVLLLQRPPSGIWGGLWSLPECPAEEDIGSWCRCSLGIAVDDLSEQPTLRHTFSHFHTFSQHSSTFIYFQPLSATFSRLSRPSMPGLSQYLTQ